MEQRLPDLSHAFGESRRLLRDTRRNIAEIMRYLAYIEEDRDTLRAADRTDIEAVSSILAGMQARIIVCEMTITHLPH